jgi:glucan 1,3-beta-glucosidase
MKFILALVSALATIASARNCGDDLARGVNLGGWLMLEPWITPSIFEEVNVGDNYLKVVDEYTYAQYVDPVFAKERLERYTCHYLMIKL